MELDVVHGVVLFYVLRAVAGDLEVEWPACLLGVLAESDDGGDAVLAVRAEKVDVWAAGLRGGQVVKIEAGGGEKLRVLRDVVGVKGVEAVKQGDLALGGGKAAHAVPLVVHHLAAFLFDLAQEVFGVDIGADE